MPRSLQDIIDHADTLADRFESAEPGRPADGAPLRKLADLVEQRGRTESAISDAVIDAREGGLSWSAIGTILGTSGEAARQRYGTTATAGRGTGRRVRV